MTVDLGQVAAIGGPISGLTAILVVLVNAYLSARKDKREQQASDVQTDSGIVDNAKKVIDLVRGETDRMESRIVNLTNRAEQAEAKNRELEAHINNQDDIIARQQRQIEWLTEDLARARQEIKQLREMT
jgi:chromosome segregation ATPase